MAVCAECGQDNPEGFRFCGACGAALVSAEPREVRKTVTVVFADVVSSTELGERADPEAVRATMRRFFQELRTIIERHGGTVEKFIGDAVMAVFGVPRAHEDDALRAVRAAAEMREAVGALELQARIGVNTGEVVAGEAETLVTGDAVNVAARLEQGAEPGEVLIGAETRQLVRDAVHAEPVELSVKGKSGPVQAYRLVSVDPEAPAVARRLDSPLVGRHRELERLRQDFGHAAAERACHLFTLLGPAGVGKSRLVAEFLDGIGEGARVVRSRCLHYGEGITYWPLVEILLALGADPEAVLALPSPQEAAVASRKLLESRAAEQPLVVVFDDLQWAEPTFLDLVEHVADSARDAPLVLLCVARPELLDVRPAWGGGKLNATSIFLEPLAEEEASMLIDNLLGGAELPDETRRRIVEAADGNPLFVEEMLLVLAERGDSNGDVSVPPTIQALLQARLDLLASEERSVVERGSVEGHVFHRSSVSELAPPPVRLELDEHLASLVRKELIRREPPTIPGDDAFRFRHLLIRDAAYESLPKEIRAELHERFADWLDAHVELVEQDEIVGYHLEQAVLYQRELGHSDNGLDGRAAGRLTVAGQAAVGRGDNRGGAALLERAAMLLAPGSEQRLPALPDLALALLDLGRFEDAGRYIAELAASNDERWQAHAALLRPWHGAASGSGSFDEGRPAFAAAKTTFERLGDDVGLARALYMQGAAEWTSCRAGAAAQAFHEAIPFAERAHDAALVEEIRGWLVTAYGHGPMPIDEVEQEVRAILDASPGLLLQMSALRALGRFAAMRGDFETGRRLMQRGREELADGGFVVVHAATSQGSAMVERLAGDVEAELRVLREGFERLNSLNEHAFASTNAANIAEALCRRGDNDEAAKWVAVARDLSPEGDLGTLAWADSTEAVLLARRGQPEAAERLARHAVAQAETTDFWDLRGGAYEALAEVLAAVDKGDEARAAQETAVRIYEDKGNVASAERARAADPAGQLGP
jgi:class 3 adenylate cyclase/tetratricopeptide (TPR) repeat protein